MKIKTFEANQLIIYYVGQHKDNFGFICPDDDGKWVAAVTRGQHYEGLASKEEANSVMIRDIELMFSSMNEEPVDDVKFYLTDPEPTT